MTPVLCPLDWPLSLIAIIVANEVTISRLRSRCLVSTSLLHLSNNQICNIRPDVPTELDRYGRSFVQNRAGSQIGGGKLREVVGMEATVRLSFPKVDVMPNMRAFRLSWAGKSCWRR